MTSVFLADTPDAAAEAAADRLTAVIAAAREARSAAHIALAGGTTPRKTYELLASRIDDWTGVEVWFGDERAVGPDDPESNFRMASETLLADGAGPEVHRIEGERGSEEAAAAYAAELEERLPREDGVPVLDLALQVGASGVCVAVHDAPKPPPDRITLTVPVLRAARSIVFLATGAAKVDAVRGLLAGPDPEIPSSLLTGDHTEVIVDRDAAPVDAG
jgi:6-phosphogluconolactonase